MKVGWSSQQPGGDSRKRIKMPQSIRDSLLPPPPTSPKHLSWSTARWWLVNIWIPTPHSNSVKKSSFPLVSARPTPRRASPPVIIKGRFPKSNQPAAICIFEILISGRQMVRGWREVGRGGGCDEIQETKEGTKKRRDKMSYKRQETEGSRYCQQKFFYVWKFPKCNNPPIKISLVNNGIHHCSTMMIKVFIST